MKLFQRLTTIAQRPPRVLGGETEIVGTGVPEGNHLVGGRPLDTREVRVDVRLGAAATEKTELRLGFGHAGNGDVDRDDPRRGDVQADDSSLVRLFDVAPQGAVELHRGGVGAGFLESRAEGAAGERQETEEHNER